MRHGRRHGRGPATVDLDGKTYYFCGQGCADAFEDDPERFRMEERLR
ncbi:YHS domain-containing protein [Haladaptatus sp. R4]|nr:YHS domain-containing protein [Haladaptatus sp. R4]